MAFTTSDLIRLALMEIRAVRAGDVVNPNDNADALLILNRYLDLLNTTDRALFSTTFTTFSLTASLQPHTIGLTANSPTFAVSVNRPTKILEANIVLSGNIRVPLTIIDYQQWDMIRAGAASGQTATITSSVPLYLSYKPDWPNGSIYLWPVASASSIELRFQTLLAALALTDTFTLPMGYQEAVSLTLAERLAPAFGQSVSPETREAAREARAAVWGQNDVVPGVIADGGVPMGINRHGRWNYLTGQLTDS
jgi:hypothetical protein